MDLRRLAQLLDLPASTTEAECASAIRLAHAAREDLRASVAQRLDVLERELRELRRLTEARDDDDGI